MSRASAGFVGIVVGVIAISGCDAPSADPAAASSANPVAEHSLAEHALEVTTVLEALPTAWNARDASMWVANFEQSSGFTNILGMHFEDRAANEARHATLFGSIFSQSHLEAEVLDVRILGDDAAVAEVAFRLVGYERLPPGVSETVPGELRTRLITVLERTGGQWQIVAAQNTALLPLAVAPPAG